MNGLQREVDARHDHPLLDVEQLGANNDLVNSDRTLNCVVLECTGENGALNVRAGEVLSHLVGSWLLVADGGDTEVIAEVIVAVAVVGGLDDFDILVVLALELRKWNLLWARGDVVLSNRGDVVHGLALTSD